MKVVKKGSFILILILFFVFVSCDKQGSDGPDGPPETEVSLLLDAVLKDGFSQSIQIKRSSDTYAYLLALSEEAVAQVRGRSNVGLPLLYKEKNFPTVYDYYTGNKTDSVALFKTMIGWLSAMQLSELCPSKRNQFYRAGYEAGGFTMYKPIYGYPFKGDPNVARLVASAVYAALHSILKPNTDVMRAEVGGSKYAGTLAEVLNRESRTHVTNDAFYVDLRMFMASAPGPYAPDHKDREDNNPTFPDEKLPNGCLKVDMDIYNHIVGKYNLPDKRAVQAIADKEGGLNHILGTDKRNVGGKYDFNAVFGQSTIGMTINPEGKIGSFILLMRDAGSSARGILQHTDHSVGPYEYGRLRPGCSEEFEAVRKSYTDDRLNVLTDFVIEDNDGHKPTYDVDGIEKYYYDNGSWTSAEIRSEEDYENWTKNQLYANSYPSGHSSAIWSITMSLIELYPQKADLIMRAANDFALSRTISRYHWNSDVIQGKIAGSTINPVCHATSDYNQLLEAAATER